MRSIRVDPVVRERHNATARAANRRRRLAALTHYGGDPPRCACCGVREVPFLVLDHINGGGVRHFKEIGTPDLARWLKAQNYPPGFRVLCHNCNFALGAFGECPHQSTSTPI